MTGRNLRCPDCKLDCNLCVVSRRILASFHVQTGKRDELTQMGIF